MKSRLLRAVAGSACVAAAVLAIGALGGCGQKGPLYLPDEKLEELERKRDEEKPAKSSMGTGTAPAARSAPARG